MDFFYEVRYYAALENILDCKDHLFIKHACLKPVAKLPSTKMAFAGDGVFLQGTGSRFFAELAFPKYRRAAGDGAFNVTKVSFFSTVSCSICIVISVYVIATVSIDLGYLSTSLELVN